MESGYSVVASHCQEVFGRTYGVEHRRFLEKPANDFTLGCIHLNPYREADSREEGAAWKQRPSPHLHQNRRRTMGGGGLEREHEAKKQGRLDDCNLRRLGSRPRSDRHAALYGFGPVELIGPALKKDLLRVGTGSLHANGHGAPGEVAIGLDAKAPAGDGRGIAGFWSAKKVSGIVPAAESS